MGRQIAVVSGKGGVGKTTIAGGIAGTLAAMGRCVLLVDGDVGLGNLDLMLRIEGEAVHDLLEVLDGHCPLRSAVESCCSVSPPSCARGGCCGCGCCAGEASRARRAVRRRTAGAGCPTGRCSSPL